jgi:hypothetical protein
MTDAELKSELIEWAETVADAVVLVRRLWKRWRKSQ